jgi:branched-chain amino acid transport system ATP-binding protein
MTAAALEVARLSAGYGALPVIKDLKLSVADGEVLAIIGRNGAGKTTTLVAIAGLLANTTGTVSVAGQPISGPAFRRARASLGLVLEGRSVFPSLTVAQNLTVGRTDVAQVCEEFPELQRRMHVKAGQLSGGEQQLLSLARAMARRPQVLLIDELSFGLAPVICDRLFTAIRQYADTGRSVVLVEQHLHYAERVADRVLVMHQGRFGLELAASELRKREAEIERLYLGGPELAAPPPSASATS